MRITQWGELGALSCIFLAQQHSQANETVRAQSIAEAHGIDLLYTQQILQRLRKGDVITSVRGSTGGYKLSRAPSQITLRQILSASEGDTFEVICETKPINSEKCRSDSFCSLKPIWFKLRDHIDTFLDSITLEQLQSSVPQDLDLPIQIGKDSHTT